MSEKILLADDNKVNRYAFEKVLTNAGYQIITARDGRESLKLFQEFKPDLVVTDVHMPGMDGFESVKCMRSVKDTQHVPIIFISAAYQDIQSKIKAIDLGVNDYLIQPVDGDELLAKIKAMLKVKSLYDELYKTQEALKKSERRFRTLAMSAPVGIFQTDTAGNCIYVNESWCKIAGISSEEALGRGWEKGLHPEDRERIATSWYQAVIAHQDFSLEYRFLQPAGLTIWVAGNATELQNHDGKTIGYLGTITDITKRKNAEEKLRQFAGDLEEKNKDLEDFVYVISHDLQEPLLLIQSFTKRLQLKCGQLLRECGEEYFFRTEDAAKRMQDLLNGLLMYSRITTKDQNFIPVSLRDIAEEVIADLQIRLEQTKGRIEIGNLNSINAAPLQLRQLLQNLISNGLKYHMPDEPPVVKLSSRILKGEDNSVQYCQIKVQDNGIGFDDQYLDRIFGMFERLHTQADYKGTGVGLAICKRIVERHNGTITAQSKPGEGSTFIVTLPVG